MNKNFSPPLGRGSSSNGISYSNAAALSVSQSVNEATWIPSYRGANSVNYVSSVMLFINIIFMLASFSPKHFIFTARVLVKIAKFGKY